LVFSILIFFSRCSVVVNPEIKKGLDIDQKTFKEISAINEVFVKSLKTKDLNLLQSIVSAENNKKEKANELISDYFIDKEIKVIDQFYVNNYTTSIGELINKDFSNYFLHYEVLAKEMYFSFLVPKDSTFEYLITLVYGKEPDGWKILDFNVGFNSIDGMNTEQHLEKAKKQYMKGELICAFFSAYYAKMCSKSSQYIVYNNTDEISNYLSRIENELKKTIIWPIEIEEIKTKPKIFNIEAFQAEEGFYPMIKYISTINLNDTIALKEENELIHICIGKYFKGIKSNYSHLLYRVFKNLPKKSKEFSYGFIKSNSQE